MGNWESVIEICFAVKLMYDRTWGLAIGVWQCKSDRILEREVGLKLKAIHSSVTENSRSQAADLKKILK
ncbi:MAG: hypothetical protein HC786_24450 [Richelia sp. CSU_2_1]|nr:hypothetical protein [Microcoleus sp. SU_5_6]NJL70027.1 hypothetical protein [Microcoleus sp. SM1_3_4]NJR25083.1 hypothetical protein [Richelia sp. CSU_2_1]